MARTSSGFATAHATAPVGPGSVNLLTGDYAVAATDAEIPTWIGSLSAGRTLTTLHPPTATGATGVFGPGWRASMLGADAGDADLTVTDATSTNATISFTSADGTAWSYLTKTPTGSYPLSYTGQADARDGSYATKVSATQITLNEPDGTVTTWNLSGGVWQPATVTQTTTGTATLNTSYTLDAQGRVTQIVAPKPKSVSSCSPLVAGCRAVNITYATTTTAVGTDSASWGDFAGQVQSISYTAADPARSAIMTTSTVAQFLYDSTGHLRASWDPRVSPALKTTYDYDVNGRLATLTPPGLAPWSFAYDSQGRLSTVSRTDPVNGIATTTVVYGVPFTGAGAPVELGSATTATWGETTDLPATGTAVFPPDHQPAGTTAATVSSSDWPYASLHYLDVNGREVNSAEYGAGTWQIDTARYDQYGNLTSSLDAGRRAEALNPTSDTDTYVTAQSTSAERAQLLSTVNTYSSDGTMLLSTLGPTRPVQLDTDTTGATVDARPQTQIAYDEGSPGGATYRLPTTSTSSVLTVSTGVTHDTQIVKRGYDPISAETKMFGGSLGPQGSGWDLRTPTTVSTQMGNGKLALVQTTEYDEYGQVVVTRLPSDAAIGTMPDTTYFYYYGTTGPCKDGTDATASAGMLCVAAPASDMTTGGMSVPQTTTTYDLFGQPVTSVVKDPASATTRTTAFGYDTAERLQTSAYTSQPWRAAGTDLPMETTSYSSATGLPTTVTAGGISVSTGYDTLGRVTTYTDADGNITTTGYDIDGRPITVNDGKGTTTYSYDGTGEHRGLLTAIDAGISGSPSTFTAAYDAAGRMTSQTLPTGLTQTVHYDDGDNPTSLTYAKGGTTWLAFTQTHSAAGRVRDSVTPGSHDDYSYDPAGRLTTVQDTTASGGVSSCVTRVYGYDLNSNRTSLKSYPDDSTQPATGHCTTATTPTTATHNYNGYDQITDSGYAYDALGRTTSVPSIDARGGGALTLGYFVDDMPATETQGTRTKTWALDPIERYRTEADNQSGITATNHYSDGTDSPSWIANSDGTWSRNVVALDSNLGLIQSSSGTPQLQLANLHGDVVATADDTTTATGINGYSESTEFGVARVATANPSRYGWLGGKRRSSDALGNLVLMGVRLYNANTGRFLQTDPVAGGSANDYDYADQDPINKFDLNGLSVTNVTGDGGGTFSLAASFAIAAALDALLSGAAHDISSALHQAVAAGAKVAHGVASTTRSIWHWVRGEDSGASQKKSDEEIGKELATIGNNLLGSGHSEAGKKAWQEFYGSLSSAQRKLYVKAGGRKARKRN